MTINNCEKNSEIMANSEKYPYINSVNDVHNNLNEQNSSGFLNESSKHAEEIGKFGTYNYSFLSKKIFYSENYFKMLGCEPVLKPLEPGFTFPFIHPDDLKKVKKFNEEIYNEEETCHEYRIIRKDGKIIHVRNDSKTYYDANKNKWITGILRDITDEYNKKSELEHALKTIRESEDHYHMMIEEVVDYAILFLDKEGNITNWNKGAERIKGYTPKEIIGKSFTIFYPEEDREKGVPFKLLEQAKKNGRAHSEGWRVRKDGTKFWGSVVITAIFDQSKKLLGFSKVTRDLTDKKIAEDQIREHGLLIEQKNRDLENMNKELQAFAYISSHDLQEPLRKINTFITFILENDSDNFSEKSKIYFEKIQNAATRMRTLINDLLKYAHTKVDDRKFEKTDIRELINELHSEMSEAFDAKNAKLKIMESCELKVIPFQFKQLFANLLSNSLKFTSPDRTPEIKISCTNLSSEEKVKFHLEEYDNYKRFTVSDNGIGFEPKYRERVFNLMERLNGKHEYSGTGIGLSICKKIIENHHGIIFADSEKGEGATFTFIVPKL